jgi:Zn-dependent protease with chaperone function
MPLQEVPKRRILPWWKEVAVFLEAGPLSIRPSIPLVAVVFGPLLLAPAAAAQVSGAWDGGEAFGRMVLRLAGSTAGGNYEVNDGRIYGSFQDNVLTGAWTQETSNQRCSQPALDGRYYWGKVLLRFTGNTFSGGWSYCEAPAAFDGSAAGTRLQTAEDVSQTAGPARTAQVPALVPITAPRDVEYSDYRLKINPGWVLPTCPDKGRWVIAYGRGLKNGPASPVHPLQVDLYAQGRPYSGESERRLAVEEFRNALWNGNAPVEHADTMKVAGVQADLFQQKGTTGWHFYLFPYNGASVYGVHIFSPGDKPELPAEAAQLLAALKLKPVRMPPKPTVTAKDEKAPKDYLKNVGGGLNLFSEAQEAEMGFNTSSQMNQVLSLVGDAPVQSYVESLGQRLVAASRKPGLQCRFFVVNTREVNAFALPGCFVYVNRAIIDLAQSEGQLAGIIGHEIGHVIGRHGARQLSKQLLILGLIQGASEAVRSKSEEWADIIATAGGFGAMLAKLKYSRDDEHQADALGVETLVAAGYDPHDLGDFFRLMDPASRLDTSSRIMGILSTHPITADREKVLSAQVDHLTFRGDAEAAGLAAFQNVRARLADWPKPPSDGDVTLANALAAAGAGGPVK